MDIKDRTPMMLILDISKKFRDVMREKSESIGLVDSYRPILCVLKKHDGCTQQDICKYTQLKAPTISLTLQKMESNGLIRRDVDQDDKRNIRIYITDKVLGMQKEIDRMLKETDNEFFKGLSEEEVKEGKEILLKIASNIGLYEGNDK